MRYRMDRMDLVLARECVCGSKDLLFVHILFELN